MTQAEIVQKLFEISDLPRFKAVEAVETMFTVMKRSLASGEDIKISGFGSFAVRDKGERLGRNPQIGKPILISARRVVDFKPSQVLKSALNS